MNTNFNIKTLLVSIVLITLILLSSIVVAKEERWFDKTKPSDNINATSKQTLLDNQMYIWNTTGYWKDRNCYYFDLYIGNESKVLWQDKEREIACEYTNVTLTAAEIEAAQILNVKTLLNKLAESKQVATSNVTKIASIKEENLKKGTVTDGTTVISLK